MALKLGRTIAELEASMSWQELEEWRYYFSVVPTDAHMIVHHIAQQTAAQLQVKGSKVKMSDFIIDYDQSDQKSSPKDVMASLLEQIKGEL